MRTTEALSDSPETGSSLGTVLGPWLCCALGLVLGGCTDSETAAERPDSSGWDLVVVVLDALPAQALGTYGRVVPGYEQTPVSPNIDAFARDAIVFEDAWSSASYTLASTASLFTGTTPATHGVLGLATNVLAPEHQTLAEAFQGSGFATAALSSNPHVSEEGAFDQGFDLFRHYFRDVYDNHALPKTFGEDAGAWWRNSKGKRRFLYAHALPPHQPYDPPAPDAGMFGSAQVDRLEGLTPFLIEASTRLDLHPELPLIKRIRQRYDAGVHYADRVFGELLAELGGPDGKGLENTVVVLVSDHGEGFAEHGRILHGNTVYAEMCNVPLLIRMPDGEGSRVTSLVGTRDLAATLCELFDVAWAGDMPDSKGMSFLGRALGQKGPIAPVLSRSVGDHPLWALRTEDFTLIKHKASASHELYARQADPNETENISQANSAKREAMDEQLKGLLQEGKQAGRAYPTGSVPRLTHKDALEALGSFE
jgi:choline-sulfatase